LTSSVRTSEEVQEARYKVVEFIATVKEPHTIAETLLMPACKEMVKIVLDPEAANEI
jgi:hypothetical protein